MLDQIHNIYIGHHAFLWHCTQYASLLTSHFSVIFYYQSLVREIIITMEAGHNVTIVGFSTVSRSAVGLGLCWEPMLSLNSDSCTRTLLVAAGDIQLRINWRTELLNASSLSFPSLLCKSLTGCLIFLNTITLLIRSTC